MYGGLLQISHARYRMPVDNRTGSEPSEPCQLFLPVATITFAGLTPCLSDDSEPRWSCSSAGQTPGSQSGERSCLWPPRVATGFANTFSHSLNTRFEVIPSDRRSYRSAISVNSTSDSSAPCVRYPRSSITRRSKLSSFLSILGSSRSRFAASISCTSWYAGMNSTERLDSTPYLPRVSVSTTSATDYMTLLSGRAS